MKELMRQRIPLTEIVSTEELVNQANEAVISYFGNLAQAAIPINLAHGALARRKAKGYYLLTAQESVLMEQLTLGGLPCFISRPDLWSKPEGYIPRTYQALVQREVERLGGLALPESDHERFARERRERERRLKLAEAKKAAEARAAK